MKYIWFHSRYRNSSRWLSQVHEKEFLLKDLMIEGALGTEVRRLGDACSKRVYRILMAQNGAIETDDVEQGADSFCS